MLLSVTCPRCHSAYQPGTMHICRGAGDRVRVKPIYDKPDPWQSSLPQSNVPAQRTLSYGPQSAAEPVELTEEEIAARNPWARAAPRSAPLPTAASSEGKRQVGGDLGRRAKQKPTTPSAKAESITVNGMTVDAETLATALNLLANRRKQQRSYQKRKRKKRAKL